MKVLEPEEEEILTEQRKRASSDTQSLIKIIDRLVGLLAAEGGAGMACLALCLWLIATL